jgi:glycosyltransferase involved in cell wall biosynthesis
MCGHDLDRHLKDCDYTRVLEKCEEDFADECHYGVIRAVCEFFPDVKREGRIWYTQKGSSARPFMELTLTDIRSLSSNTQRPAITHVSAEGHSLKIGAATIHKQNSRAAVPKVSVILLDWSVRQSFHTLDWLSSQNIQREEYEIIWVELYNRVVPDVMEKADIVITCGQNGLYHKHIGYNIGLLYAKGQVITICDSDAVYPPDFISSIIISFNLNGANAPASIVLMHYERRTSEEYPIALSNIVELQQYSWHDLWPNVGACMSVRKVDAIRFGGFDEHRSFRGYLCGPNDLGWRLVNAGIPEIWHGESVTLWHFAHPHSNQSRNERRWKEMTYPHVDWHPLTAVEAFSTGRLLPLKENPEVHKLRMEQRRIGTNFEERYARMTGPAVFSKWERLKLHLLFILEPASLRRMRWTEKIQLLEVLKRLFERLFGPRIYEVLKSWWHCLNGK